jgi:hypothetical protein
MILSARTRPHEPQMVSPIRRVLLAVGANKGNVQVLLPLFVYDGRRRRFVDFSG